MADRALAGQNGGITILRLFLGLLLLIAVPLVADGSSGSKLSDLMRQADSLGAGQNLDSAIAICEMALQEAIIQFGSADTMTARVIHRLGNYHNSRADYGEARALYEQALSTMEGALGKDHLIVAEILSDLAVSCGEMGERAEAERLHRRALTIRERVLGSAHPDVATSLVNLAELLVLQGRYADAEPLIERALGIQETELSPDLPEVARSLSALAWVRLMQGKYEDAENLFEQALAKTEEIFGPEHLMTAGRLADMAGLYAHWGRSAEATPLMERALSIAEKHYGSNHLRVAASMHGLALVYGLQGKYTEAESLLRRALAIREQALGPDHPSTALCLRNLAATLFEQGRYDESGMLYERALSIWEKMPHSDHQNLSSILIEYSRLCRMGKGHRQALELAERAFAMSLHSFVDNVSVLSERAALGFSRFLRKSVANYLSCYVDAKASDTTSPRPAVNVILSGKGRVSDGIFQRQAILTEQADSTTGSLIENLRTAKMQVSELSVKESDENAASRSHKLDSLEKLADDLETQLSKQSKNFRMWQESKDIDAERISSVLPNNSVLLEYQEYDYISPVRAATVPRYILGVVDCDGNAAICDLGEAGRIDSLVTEYRRHMLDLSIQPHMPLRSDLEKYTVLARELYDAVIRPAEQFLSGKDLVFISPDGGLNLISFPGLIDGDGAYLIERLSLHHILAGRELIRLDKCLHKGKGLLAVGDPDYDLPAAARKDLLPAIRNAAASGRSGTTYARRSGLSFFNGDSLLALPGSKAEIQAIAECWRSVSQEPVTTHFGSQASEDLFKIEAPGKRVIHLATHGYCVSGQSGSPGEKDGHTAHGSRISENPLLQSGLFFAGANLRGQGADSLGIEDGVLTAYEVSAMDLHGTDMVVLSACETGLGALQQGEGVYGLRRAFQVAGVRTIISSLWPVPDRETALIMSELYSDTDETLPTKLRRLQLERIAKLRADRLADHPYTWAAFIALGDWR